MKSILITGASRGIGKATATKFLENGWRVYGTYFKSEFNTKDLKEKYKDRFIAIGPYDFCSIADTQKFIKYAKQFQFDAMFLNAGVFSENDDFVNFDYNEFNSVMNCNFYSPMMIAIGLQHNINNQGSIVLMSSNDAYSGAFASISYSASKGAIMNVMKSLSVNFGKRGIRVNSIAPGAIDTDMNTPEQVNESPKWTPLGRVAQPWEVANVVHFLCGEDSSFVNGENITIDGGYGNVSILLKKEMESSRIYGGYQELINRYNGLKKGDQLLSIDVADSGYSWVDTQTEIDYLESTLGAQKRGADVHRFIILPEEKIEEFKQNKLYRKYSKVLKNMYIISRQQLYKKLSDVFSIIGSGCDICIYKNGDKTSFIDFYADDNCVGILSDNQQITNSLYEKLLKLKTSITEGKIKVF